jgi:hypothetical protein
VLSVHKSKKGCIYGQPRAVFEMMGGGYREVVYDNMRNVVTKFIGKNEKELNGELIKMSLYYGYKINVTNCFKANEKGSVEKSVDVLRNEIFAADWKFNSLDDAREFMRSRLLKLNEKGQMEEEKRELTPYRPPLELASKRTKVLSENKVNTSSMITVDTAFYSVPEDLVGKKVLVKKYHDEIRVFYGNAEVCRHRRIFGNGNMKVDIYHYSELKLKSFTNIEKYVKMKIWHIVLILEKEQ